MREINREDWYEGARLGVLHALDNYMRAQTGFDKALGARDEDLSDLFKGIDAHMDKVAERINIGTEPGSLGMIIRGKSEE